MIRRVVDNLYLSSVSFEAFKFIIILLRYNIFHLINLGDFSDRNYAHLAETLAVDLDNYTITLYPTHELYRSFVTDTPRNICLIVVLVIAATAFVTFIYIYLVKKLEDELNERIKHSYAEAKSRKDVLLAKKVYVRYMSHEMRTPLNVMHVGLKILEIDLGKSRRHDKKRQLASVNEIMGSCDTAATFLDELLHFSKLEDGFLTIKTAKTNVLSFIASTVKLLISHAEEKGVTINFDLGPNSDLSISHSPFGDRTAECDANQHSGISDSLLNEKPLFLYLYSGDYIDIDSQKMGQVFQSMLANAIKYSPSGGTVQLKARKIVRRNPTFVFEDRKANEHAGNKLCNRWFLPHVFSTKEDEALCFQYGIFECEKSISIVWSMVLFTVLFYFIQIIF